MNNFKLNTPIALIIFNRPEKTKRVLEAIQQAKPSKLLVVADGPRVDRPGDAEKCAATRAVIDSIDWDCEVLKNYAETNLGCGLRPATGISWVFEQVEQAIILEDDCLPNPSFFQFCEELLDKYRDDERVMMISGTNILGEWKSNIQSYHFSYHGGIWGWASWRRAWNHFDFNMKRWSDPEIQQRVRDVLYDNDRYVSRKKTFDECYLGKKNDAWDYQWHFARLIQSGLSIVPAVNLIANIGFGEDSTHTKSSHSNVANLKTLDIELPIKFNDFTAVDLDYDRKFFRKSTSKSLSAKLQKKFEKLSNIYK